MFGFVPVYAGGHCPGGRGADLGSTFQNSTEVVVLIDVESLAWTYPVWLFGTEGSKIFKKISQIVEDETLRKIPLGRCRVLQQNISTVVARMTVWDNSKEFRKKIATKQIDTITNEKADGKAVGSCAKCQLEAHMSVYLAVFAHLRGGTSKAGNHWFLRGQSSLLRQICLWHRQFLVRNCQNFGSVCATDGKSVLSQWHKWKGEFSFSQSDFSREKYTFAWNMKII